MRLFTLIIFGPLLLLPVFANEIIEPDAGRQFSTIIKDVEVEDMLNKTNEFKDCREKNKFDFDIFKIKGHTKSIVEIIWWLKRFLCNHDRDLLAGRW